jgi:hypothetical protein
MDPSQETTTSVADPAKVGSHSIGSSDIPNNRGISGFALQDPEEGLRLIRSFLSIREGAVRQAITDFVTRISALAGDDPQPSA